MSRFVGIGVAVGATLSVLVAQAAHGAMTKCTMKYEVAGWSAFYKTGSGSGTITCDNKQTAHVNIRVKGGGITVGKYKITNGQGTFSDVADMGELFGSYASAGVDAGVVKSAQATVLTKGTVSLALEGKGQGIDLGVDVGEFVIEKAGKKK